MQYTFETLYNQETLSVMAKCLRKTIRKKKSKKSHRFGWIVVIMALLLTFVTGGEEFVIDFRKILTWAAVLAIVLSFLFEDRLNGAIARKRMLKGTEKAISVFNTEDVKVFTSETEIGKSTFSYEKIIHVAETERYFVFVFSENHAQIYDKSNLSGGTAAEFRSFISAVTKKEVIAVL